MVSKLRFGLILLLCFYSQLFLAFSSVSSFPSKGYECPNCSGQRIKTVDPSTENCVDCWTCPECPDGSGSSVPCGATVPVGTKIHCVLCVNGANFSDSPGTDQCQPCGVCAGEHERVLNKCTRESDVKCDCKAGFYRNNKQCLPCSSCPSCLRDKDLFRNCQKDGGEQQMERPSTTTAQSTSLASVLVTSSYSHYATSMSLLPGLTITEVLAPTRTQEISATSTSVVEHEMTPTSETTVQGPPITQKKKKDDHTRESSSWKTEIIIISVSFTTCVCLLIGLLYYTLKNSRTRQLNNDLVIFSKLNQSAIEESGQGNNEESNSCETSSVDKLTCTCHMDKTQCSEIGPERKGSEPGLPSLSGSEDKSNGTTDSVHQDDRVIANDHTEHTAAIEAKKEIPSSLEGEQRSCICQGHTQPCDLPEDAQDVASKDRTVVPSDNLHAPVDMKNKMPSGNNTAVNVVVNFRDLSQIQRGTGAVSPLGDFTSASCDNKWAIPASSSGMTVSLNQGTICGLSSIAAPAAQPTEGNRGYATHITLVPLPVINEMCRLLDLDRNLIDGSDYTRLGSELGLDLTQIQTLKQKCPNPSFALLMQVFPALPNSGTLGHLIPLLKNMRRHDVIEIIDRWVGRQQCTQAVQGN